MISANNYQESTDSFITTEDHSTLGFVDNQDVRRISISTKQDPTTTYENYADATLSEFFSRPVLVSAGLWNVSTNLDLTLNVWHMYFNDAYVKRKLDNYTMFRAKLHVKVSFSGTPFHYSRVFVVYQPDNVSQHRLATYPTLPEKLMKASCMPHAVLDPSVQSPVQIDCPLIIQDNYVLIEDLLAASVDLGVITLLSSDPLLAVSATASAAIPYNVFVWASEVDLVIPTHKTYATGKKSKRTVAYPNIHALKQSTIPPNEKKDGMISSVSTVVANAAGALSKVPFIGGTASMVADVANGVSSLAHFFGFSRPQVLTDPIFVKNRALGSVAYTESVEMVEKLTFDPLQAVSVDPAVNQMGPEDELAIRMFTNKESLFSTVYWSSTDAVNDVIFWTNVTPNIVRYTTIATGARICMSSIAYAAMPFKYWSGSLVYRFQFVASKFHTGKLRITYEPLGHAYSSANYNTTYSQIIDLDGTADVTFVVPWAQSTPYKLVGEADRNNYFIPPAGVYNYTPTEHNGILYVTVLNPLMSPDALKDISINCYIRGGEDFEVAVPDARFTSLNVQPAIAYASVGNATLAPDKLAMLFGEPMEPSEIALKQSVFFGESINSFRSLLKRYAHFDTRIGSRSTALTSYTTSDVYYLNFPSPGGFRNNYYTSTIASATEYPYSFGGTNLLSYISLGFLGRRGAIRFKFTPKSTFTQVLQFTVARDCPPPDVDMKNWKKFKTSGFAVPPSQSSGLFTLEEPSTWRGAVVNMGTDGLPASEVEIPWYSPLRYSRCEATTMGCYTGDADIEETVIQIHSWLPVGNLDEVYIVDAFVATGEDFTLNFYLGPPLFYSYSAVYVPY